MRVLFGFRGAQILVVQIGKHLRQNLLQLVRLDHRLQPRPILVVLGHRHIEKISWPFAVDKLVKIRRGQCVRHLPSAIRSEIVKNNRVVAVNQPKWFSCRAFGVGHYNWLDEFVGDPGFVTRIQRGDRIDGPRFSFAVYQGAIREFHALPTIVAVHRIISSDQCGDFPDAQLPHFLL